MPVPNQKIITVYKQKCDNTHKYTVNNLSALDSAVKLLKNIGSLKLYIYLAKNQSNYQLELSRSHFMAWSGLSKTAYDNGVKELIEKGFLIKTVSQDKKSQYYIFRDKPLDIGDIDEEEQPTDHNKGFVF